MSIKNFKDFLTESNGSENNQQYQYMLLSRLKMDCEYFLGNGRGSEKILYYENVPEHIAGMKVLWNELVVKPEWLSLDDINNYEEQMLNYNDDEVNSELEDDTEVRYNKIRKNQIDARR